MRLGLPKIALGISDGANCAVRTVQREMLLAQKGSPYIPRADEGVSPGLGQTGRVAS